MSVQRYYIVGCDEAESHFRILKLDRTLSYSRSTMEEPPVVEVAAVYSREECENLLATIRVGNKATGGMHKVMDFYGVIGFIRFTEGYYMVLITRRRPVATLGGYLVYHIEDTSLLSIRGSSKLERKTEESRYVSVFQSVDLNQNFYFSYAYDLTNSLQRNMARDPTEPPRYNSMFMWNHYLVSSAFPGLTSDWVLPVVHGFVDQRCLEMLGHDLYLTLIARRSRHFAGTRFLKRGAN
ncbi:SacI homology domain-containing protein, partial [Syncephalis pseudoplumigaleata]